MADTNEEQLLSDLLCAIAREDASLEAPYLEERIMMSLQTDVAPTTARHYVRHLAAAAAVTAAVASVWMTRQAAPVEPAVAETPHIVTDTSVPVHPTTAMIPAIPTRPTPLTRPTTRTRPAALTRPAQPAVADAEEFLPLMPMTDQELSGPFQLVRVQMPRASLGALRSPLDHPNELVEADVLLGEDGMARAIRVSSGGAIQPWRSR